LSDAVIVIRKTNMCIIHIAYTSIANRYNKPPSVAPVGGKGVILALESAFLPVSSWLFPVFEHNRDIT
jgi:hypothetical protein